MQAGGGGARGVIRGAGSGWEGLFYDCVPQAPSFMKHKSHAHAFIYTKSLSLNVHIITTGQKGGGYHGNSVR